MKKFFIRIFIFYILLLGSIPAVILLFPLPENSYTLAIIDKNHILADTGSPKIVLVGGSNLGFGVDSAAIQSAFHLPVVNMGLHAGFGLGRILDDVSPFLRTGDILIIVAEYSHFTSNWNGVKETYELIFDARQFRLLWSPYYGPSKEFPAYLKSFQGRFLIKRSAPRDHPPVYSRDGFNEYGDFVKHLKNKNLPFTPDAPKENSEVPNRLYLDHFFQFVDDFSSRGITVLLSYPSYEEQSFRNNAELIQELDQAFRGKINLRVISKPESYCFPTGLFYDTAYHLNAEGRVIRTERLIQDLEASGTLPRQGGADPL
ncbi:MAG: hypothetical protein LBG84_03690 [Treponema sp.]|jgi:hypothetical protein|nr:hypothetical protein [Treponema sp.]